MNQQDPNASVANVAEPKAVHQVVFVLLDNGSVSAQTTAHELQTMNIVGQGMAALAVAMQQKKNGEKRIVAAPSGLLIPKLQGR